MSYIVYCDSKKAFMRYQEKNYGTYQRGINSKILRMMKKIYKKMFLHKMTKAIGLSSVLLTIFMGELIFTNNIYTGYN